MVQKSVQKVLTEPASARAASKTLNVQEGQEPEKEPDSQELNEQLKEVRAQCGELKDLLHQAVGSRGKTPTATQRPQKPGPGPSVKRGLNTSGDPVLNPPQLQLPVAPPSIPVEMRCASQSRGTQLPGKRDVGRDIPLNGIRASGKVGIELAGPVRGAIRGDHVGREVL
jgi:hypothetical protein